MLIIIKSRPVRASVFRPRASPQHLARSGLPTATGACRGNGTLCCSDKPWANRPSKGRDNDQRLLLSARRGQTTMSSAEALGGRRLTTLPHRAASRRCLKPPPHSAASRRCLAPLPHCAASLRCLTALPHRAASCRCLTPLPNSAASLRCLNSTQRAVLRGTPSAP